MSVVDSNLAKNFASRCEFRREFPARSRRDFGRRKFASRWGSCRDSWQEYWQDFGCREAENLGKIPDSRRIPARFWPLGSSLPDENHAGIPLGFSSGREDSGPYFTGALTKDNNKTAVFLHERESAKCPLVVLQRNNEVCL